MSHSISSYSYDDEDLDEAEQEFSEERGFSEKDNVIFVIDATLPMHSADESGMTHFNGALRCTARFLQNKIIQSESDLMGLVFFGTRESKNDQEFKHIYVKYDLDSPDAERILELEKLENDSDWAATTLGRSDDYSLAEVLWTCSNLFSAKGQKFSSKRIFLITHNDNPHSNNLAFQRNAKVRAQDLQDLGILIDLFPVETSSAIFDFEKFFRDLPAIVGAEAESGERPASASRKYEEMQRKILRREVKKRTAFRVPLQLHDSLVIGVRGYNLVLEQKKSNHTYLDSRSNAEVKAGTSWMCSASAQFLMPTEMKSYWTYGGEKIVFSKEEVQEIKYFRDPGLVLLGFKDQSLIKPHYNLKHGAFIYPDESEFTGSSSVFIHFLHRLDLRKKVALCRFIPRKNAAPRLVALFPQKSGIDSNGDEVPCGFDLVYMPYSDDIRSVPKHNAVLDLETVGVESVNSMKEIIEAIPIRNYDASDYENPVLQKCYNNLQAIALQKDFPEELHDTTLPPVEGIHRLAGSKIQRLLENAVAGMVEVIEPPKRKRAAGADSSNKRSNAAAVGQSDILEKYRDGKLTSLTVAQLSAFVKDHKEKPLKKKADIIAQVEAICATL
ncbi:SPOC like C-terminal domain-containing protein [Phlyctochytrium arcticum]|nr:SPOC like C-terminal domain-containing protein [Phlyctochytrium arcticum]